MKKGKLKILVTGFTALQVGGTKRPIQKIDVPALMVDELRRQGHEVDWKGLLVGQEPRGYDGMIVGMGQACSFTSYRALNAVWLLSRKLPAVLFWDDWKTREMINSYRGLAKRGDRQVDKTQNGGKKRFYWGTPEECLTAGARNAIYDVAEAMGEQRAPKGVDWRANLYPLYDWGDVKQAEQQGIDPSCRQGMGHLTVDPSALIELLPSDFAAGVVKSHEWFLASIGLHDRWVEEKAKPSWDVQYAGSRKLTREGKAVRLDTELDVQRMTAERWGTLAPEYRHVAAGWWRSRFLYAAKFGCVLAGDPGAARMLGPAYALTCADVERRPSQARLERMAREQAEAFLPKIGTKKTFAAQVAAVAEALR